MNICKIGFLSLVIMTFSYGCIPIKAKLNFNNYCETDMTVNLESYNKKGDLKVNNSFSISKGTKDSVSGKVKPTSNIYETDGYKGGNIKIKYYPSQSQTRFSLDPIKVPNSDNDLERSIPLTGLVLYDKNDNKQRLESLGTELKFTKDTSFTRLIDMEDQLGSLILGRKEGNILSIVDNIIITDIDIKHDEPSTFEDTTITEKKVIGNLKLSIPVYGSVESKMSNDDLHQVKWAFKHYPFQSNANIAQLISNLDSNGKKALIAALKLHDKDLSIFILRGFDVIESGVFAVTNATKINTDVNAAIASVFTAEAAYAFKAEDSKFVSIPNKAYNIRYQKWQTVSELITKLSGNKRLIMEDKFTTVILTPKFNF